MTPTSARRAARLAAATPLWIAAALVVPPVLAGDVPGSDGEVRSATANEDDPGGGCGVDPASARGRVPAGVAQRELPRPGFSVRLGEEASPYWVSSFFVLPRQVTRVEAVMPGGDARFVASAEAGTLERLGPAAWTYAAPAHPGVYALTVCDALSNRTSFVNVFVLEPYDGQEVFHGYRIGTYPGKPLRDDPAYKRPRGFVRVTEENEDTWVSPHFQLRQFLCKQESGYPKFLLLKTRLLTKLEMLIETLRERGTDVDGLFVMSAYRTPWYNRAIGNTTRYSRHAYGDAADVFIDNDGNGWMDDVNGDGKATRADARVIADAVDTMAKRDGYAPYRGGLGVYSAKPHRGPFVHVDTRGKRARW